MENDPRETAILDAASELFVRFGYDKTSVSDIARTAGISKGAVYLVFTSKDDLFESLLLREMFRFSQAWFAGVDRHPRGGTIGAMYESMLRALDQSAFMANVYRRDPLLLGRYLRKPGNFFESYAVGQPSRHEAIALLQDVGAVRRDADPRIVAHIVNMIARGLVSPDPLVPSADVPPTDEVISAVADFMNRALPPEEGYDPRRGKRVLRELFEAGQSRFLELLQQRAVRRNERKDPGGSLP